MQLACAIVPLELEPLFLCKVLLRGRLDNSETLEDLLDLDLLPHLLVPEGEQAIFGRLLAAETAKLSWQSMLDIEDEGAEEILIDFLELFDVVLLLGLAVDSAG